MGDRLRTTGCSRLRVHGMCFGSSAAGAGSPPLPPAAPNPTLARSPLGDLPLQALRAFARPPRRRRVEDRDDHRSPWLRAAHDASASRIVLRAWSDGQLVTRKACYDRAREWQGDLPDVDREHLVADDLRKLLKGKDGRVAVGVTDTGMTPKSTGGFVVAVVADVRRCVVFAFETQAAGASAEDIVLDRLTLVTERLLPSLESDASFAPARETATPRKR